MARKASIIPNGTKFGNYTVVQHIGLEKGLSKGKKEYTYRVYLCRCICGKEVKCRESNIRYNTRGFGCGCIVRADLARLRSKEPGTSSVNRVLDAYFRGAKRRGHSWDLSYEQFKELISACCFYCGCAPSMFTKRAKDVGKFHNGIDRLDVTIGYRADNCVSCCKKCNIAKHIMSVKEFRDWIELVYTSFVLQKSKELIQPTSE